MTIIVHAVVDLEPAARDEALASARPHVEAALAQPGCRAYSWSADPHDQGRVHVYEQWDGEEAFAAHLAGPAYRGMLAHMQGYGIRNAVSTKHRVTQSQPVYDPAGVPRADFFS
jgi:quinol monooxygenase YgiN